MLLIGIFFSLLMLYYTGYLMRMAWHFHRLPVPASNPKVWPKVSVIVPARNEAENVGACVRAVLQQDYPKECLELIVVNDQSEDDTVERAMVAAEGDARFRCVDGGPSKGIAYKKAAVATGIRMAEGDLILSTDAECVAGPEWVKTMARTFTEDVAMVSGPVVLTGNSLFERFQVLEFMGLIAVGAGAIGAGEPTMCNGANLAYRRAAFDVVGGFAGIDHIASGDDELLMHKMVEAGMKVGFAKSGAAIVRTPAQANWSAFKAQRIRWVSKSTGYKRKSITWTLVLAWLAMAGFPLLLMGMLVEPRLGWFLLLNFGLKMLGELAVLGLAAGFFGNLRLLVLLPFEQVAHVSYVLWVGIAGNRKHYAWKGRMVR